MKISEEVVFLEEAFDILNERFLKVHFQDPLLQFSQRPGLMGILLRMILGITVVGRSLRRSTLVLSLFGVLLQKSLLL